MWTNDAACKGLDPNLFYTEPDEPDAEVEPKRICNGCPVKQECLNHALATNEKFGIWGGLNEVERKKLRRTMKKKPVSIKPDPQE